MKITKKELRELIKEEVSRIQKIKTLQERREQIQNEIRNLNRGLDVWHNDPNNPEHDYDSDEYESFELEYDMEPLAVIRTKHKMIYGVSFLTLEEEYPEHRDLIQRYVGDEDEEGYYLENGDESLKGEVEKIVMDYFEDNEHKMEGEYDDSGDWDGTPRHD